MARNAKDGAKGKNGQTEHEATVGHNGLSEEEKKVRFFNMCAQWEAARAAVKMIEEDAKEILGKQVIRDFRTSIQQRTPEGEARIKARIESMLRVLRWNAKALGTQANFLDDDDRTPSVDRAEAEGERDSLAGAPCKTDYAPDTEQYRRFIKGWQRGQSALMKAGIKPLPTQPDA